MEKLLHYAWKHRLCGSKLTATDGSCIEVINPGILNNHAGPDFFNAKIKINGCLWAGNVEIHTRSSDWYKHNHQQDASYNSVILHVVKEANTDVITLSGNSIPQCEIVLSNALLQNYEYLLAVDKDYIPCSHFLPEISPVHLAWVKESLLYERLERKARHILSFLERTNGSWNDTFYILFARNMGFGLNADPFEQLAVFTPLQIIRKHVNDLFQIEALLLGQAGFLQPSSDWASKDEYSQKLSREYDFLRKKYGLTPLCSSIFKLLRIRPISSPQLRIAQLAALCQHVDGLFSFILERHTLSDIKLRFHVCASEYWNTHYFLGQSSPHKSKFIGDSSLHNITINTIAPILFAYGIYMEQEELVERAIAFLKATPAENNLIVRLFKEAGIKPSSAKDSQALLQLKKEYCDLKKCLFCKIGYQFLTKHKKYVK